MALLIAAPAGPLGRGLLLAARGRGERAEWFDSAASRDPTLELPELAARLAPDRVVVVAPSREEPATLALLRCNGAAVAVWIPPLEVDAPRRMLSRQRWIAREADAVAVTDLSAAALFSDLHARPAIVVPIPSSSPDGRRDDDATAFAAVLDALGAHLEAVGGRR